MDNKHLPPLTTSVHPWLKFSALAGSYPAPSSLHPDYTNIACRRRASFIIYRLSRYCRGFRRQGHLIITGKWPKFWFPPPLAPVLCWQRPRPGCGGQWGRHVPRINCHGDQEQTLTRCDRRPGDKLIMCQGAGLGGNWWSRSGDDEETLWPSFCRLHNVIGL